MIINAGIERIFYLEGYPDEMAGRLLEEAGVDTMQLSPE
jgi:deoxycytidylate deaminase